MWKSRASYNLFHFIQGRYNPLIFLELLVLWVQIIVLLLFVLSGGLSICSISLVKRLNVEENVCILFAKYS